MTLFSEIAAHLARRSCVVRQDSSSVCLNPHTELYIVLKMAFSGAQLQDVPRCQVRFLCEMELLAQCVTCKCLWI